MKTGDQIGRYRVGQKLGEGGMGEVYQAEDSTLGRRVALKFLRPHLLHDEQHRKRFLREAQAAASLDHPAICTVYEIVDQEDQLFLAMPFLEGRPLSERIAEGPLALPLAVEYAAQAAAGLAYAHERGIVHRDVKPANLMIVGEDSSEPTIKIMDFGIAQLAGSTKLTQMGTTIGSVAYMSPEQSRGEGVDQRTDLWALGAVLFEMIVGRTPFQGDFDSAILYSIANEDPDPLSGLRTGVPLDLEWIVSKCLAKDPEERYPSGADLRVDLLKTKKQLAGGPGRISGTVEHLAAQTASRVISAQPPPPPEPPRTTVADTSPAASLTASTDAQPLRAGKGRTIERVAAVATILTLAAASFFLFTREDPASSVVRFSLSPEGLYGARVNREVGVSPDGKHIFFLAYQDGKTSIWLRSLEDETVRELAGTDGAVDGFWSPDSSWVGFAVGEPDFALKKVSIDGGSPITICPLPGRGGVSGGAAAAAFAGGTWSPDGAEIIFASDFRLFRAPSRGGDPELLLEPGETDRLYFWAPEFLPSAGAGEALIFTAETTPDDAVLIVLDLDSEERRELGPGQMAQYSNAGFLLHGPPGFDEGGLWALPFSVSSLEATGEGFPLTPSGDGASVSDDGVLVYRDQPGQADTMRTLAWRDREGELLEEVGQPQMLLREFALSPDGRRVAATVGEPSDVWIQDLIRFTTTRLTFSERGEWIPNWSPTGRDVSYTLQAESGDMHRMVKKSVTGTGEPVVLVDAKYGAVNSLVWSPDGRFVVFQGFLGDASGADILYAEIDDDGRPGEPRALLATPAGEYAPQLSPDGKFIAHVSDESGRNEVYLRPFPSGSGAWQVSTNGGTQPRWRGDGRELYFVEGRSTLTALPVSTKAEVELGRAQRLFDSPDLMSRNPWPQYDVSADGQRVLTATPVGDGSDRRASIRVVLNWFAEFRDRVRE